MKNISFRNFIQVAGVIDQEEADLLLYSGIKSLGFPLRLPVNTVDLSEEDARNIISTLSPPVNGIVISYSSTAKEVIEVCDKLGTEIIQLHGPISIIELETLKSKRPDIVIIKSLVITNDNEQELSKNIQEFDPYIDAYITDTYDPITGASGATGKTHDWNISKRFVEYSSKPVILAGGLNPDNVYEAIVYVKPMGVDVHTGVENSDGRKDKQLVKKFINEANKAFSFINTL